MIWLIGCKGMLGSEIARQFEQRGWQDLPVFSNGRTGNQKKTVRQKASAMNF